MRDKIYLYELEGYRNASQEMKDKLRMNPKRYFDFSDLPSEEIHELLEAFVIERGKRLAPASLCNELIYYNNIRDFLIDKDIKNLEFRKEKQIIRTLKAWMLEKGYALTSRKYRPAYDVVGIETADIIKHMKKLLRFAEPDDERAEQEKDVWNLSKFDFTLDMNPIKRTKSLNFMTIPQPEIREEVKKAVFMMLKYIPIGTILTGMTAAKRFTKYLQEQHKEIHSLQEVNRKILEEYLVHLRTEATERKDYKSDLYSLRRILETVGNIYEWQHLTEMFVSNDFPSTPRYIFSFYTDSEIKRLNEAIFKMHEQISRALILHQLLGTRISETLTLRTDCMRLKENRYFVRINPVKSRTYEMAVSDEVAQLIFKAIEYTQERYGETKYIFVSEKNPNEPYQYSMIQAQVMKMIRQKDIRDDHGELLKFGTHIFRHCYGKKLTEMHIEDWMIARLLGHRSVQSVHHYRRIGNKMMAEETRKAREEMDMLLLEIVKGWEGYEI